MKIVLIKPHSDGFNWASSHMVGLTYLAGYLREKGHEVNILDAAFLSMDFSAIVSWMGTCNAQVFGITAMTHEIPNARKIIEWLKKSQRNIWTILGGPHATAMPKEILQEIDDLDFAISGEGELPLTKLLNYLEVGNKNYSDIDGLTYRSGNNIVNNTPQAGYLDLSKTPQPAVDLYYNRDFFLQNHQKTYYLTTCRGCPYNCAYCSKALGRHVRWRSTESILEEWNKAINIYGANKVQIIDEIFLYNNKQVNEILDYLIENDFAKKASFTAAVHPNIVDRSIIKKAKKAGCILIQIGIESGNDAILQKIGRPYTIEKAYNAVQIIKEEGIKTHCYYIIGHPGETHRTIIDTIKSAIKINPFEIGLGIMVPYPGTQVYEMAKTGSEGYKLCDVDWDSYDRYGGNSIKIDGIKAWHISFYQISGYILFYFINYRFKDMYNYFRPRIRTVLFLFKKTITRKLFC